MAGNQAEARYSQTSEIFRCHETLWLARCVEEASHRLRPTQLIVQSGCLLGLCHVDRDTSLFQHMQRFRAHLKSLVHAFRQDYYGRTVLDELFDIRRLNAWDVICSRLAPVPLSSAAGIELRVLEGLLEIDLQSSPREVCDTRCDGVLVHHGPPKEEV